MAATLKNKVVKEVGTVPILAMETDASTRSTILGISLANLVDGLVHASILIHDDTSVEGYFIKDVAVPPNSSLRALYGGEKLILAPNNQLYVVSDQDEGLDVVITFADLT